MNILISGMTCSGKSTFAKEIEESFDSVSHIEQDWYFKDLKDIPHISKGYLMDTQSAFYIDEFKSDVNSLLSNKYVLMPRYNIRENRRISKDRTIYLNDINVFEGLHTINLLNDIESIKIFMNTNIDECLKRRIERDKQYGISEEVVKKYFYDVIYEVYKTHIEKQKYYSDYVIEKESDKKCLLKKLQSY